MSEQSLDLNTVLAVDDAVTRSTGSAGFGVTAQGFLPKPFTRLLAEKIALARQLIDPDLDLSAGSVVRKLLEITALEDARTWAALASTYDNSFIATATGAALSTLGAELGLERPSECATGTVKLTLAGDLPDGVEELVLPRGSRLTTLGGHRVALDAAVSLTAALKSFDVPVVSFDPGVIGDLDPTLQDASGAAPQKIDRWEPLDAKLEDLRDAAARKSVAPEALVKIDHSLQLKGGQARWSDSRYRDLLLRAPYGLWSADALAVTVGLVPGVRHVLVRDGWGGLDLSNSVFGDFDFVERLFAADRDLANPYYVTVLVAPTDGAIWDGPGGLRSAVEEALRDVRPVGVFPAVEQAEQVYVTVQADVVTRGLPLPPGTKETVNSAPATLALKARLTERLRAVVDGLQLGEPVRTSRLLHALMSEPGVADVAHLRLVRSPQRLGRIGDGYRFRRFHPGPQVLGRDENLTLAADQIAVLVDAPERLVVR